MITKVAKEYLAAKHQPEHPSYRAFVDETVEQYRALLKDGWKFALSEKKPYPDSNGVVRDLDNKRLIVFTGGSRFAKDNPMADYIVRFDNSPVLRVSEIFRAVHDVYGQKTLFKTFDGELEAYRSHKRMYSNEALPALYGETIGQLCQYWAGFGFVEIQECKIIPVRF
jgi:hypothetical protein